MIYLPNCEFYITHTCNLSCNGCHTFNDLAIGGHSRWHAQSAVYEKWAKILDIGRISLMGGEPLINPDYLIWLKNIATLWPRAKIIVYTNGTQFHRHPDLYQTIVELNKSRPGIIEIIVSVHEPKHRALALKLVNDYFKNPQQKLTYLDDKQVPEYAETYCDDQRVVINIKQNFLFHNNSLVINADHTASLYHSDPEKAFEICNLKTCHHMQDGRLYKCGPMGMLPYVVKQYQINGRPQDLDLLYSYEPATTDWSVERIAKFVDELKQKKSIPQCGLCPEKFVYAPVDANRKKTFLLKRV